MSRDKKETDKSSPIAEVPVDVLKLIFKDLDTKSLSHVSQVSKKFHTVSSSFLHKDKMQHLKDTLLDEKKILSSDSIKKICDELAKNKVPESDIYQILDYVIDFELEKEMNDEPNEPRLNNYMKAAQDRYPLASLINTVFVLQLSQGRPKAQYKALVTLCVVHFALEHNPGKYEQEMKLISTKKFAPIKVIDGTASIQTESGPVTLDEVIEKISQLATLPRKKQIPDASPEIIRDAAFEDAKEIARARGLIKNSPPCTIL